MKPIIVLLLSTIAAAQSPATQLATLQGMAASVIQRNHFLFSDSTDGWNAAPHYDLPFSDDTWMAFQGYPSYFTAAQVRNIYVKFFGAADGSGHIPIALNTNASAALYYSGCNPGAGLFPTTDSLWFLPQMMLLDYQKSGNTASFATYLAQLEAQYALVPRDTNHLVNAGANTSQSWIPFGNEDGIQFTGDNLLGSVMYYYGRTAMAQLYTIIGDSTHATAATADAALVKSNISALWDSTDGMFYSSLGQNNQIDIFSSAFAVWTGITTDPENTAIANYLITNYNTITTAGYVRQSPINWSNSYTLAGQLQCGRGVGNYDDGYWSSSTGWVAYAIAKVSITQARQIITDYLTATDPTIEWIGQNPVNVGATENMMSVLGPMWFASTSQFLETGSQVTAGGTATTGVSIQ